MSQTARANLTDLTVTIHAQTTAAIMVSDDGEREHACWLPLSETEVNERKGAIAEITIPEWLAKDRGLI